MKKFYIDWYEKIANSIKVICINNGLSEKESIYIYNKFRNAIRRVHTDCINGLRISINNSNDKEYNEIKNNNCDGAYDEIIKLYSGTIVKIGFNYD